MEDFITNALIALYELGVFIYNKPFLAVFSIASIALGVICIIQSISNAFKRF